MLTRFFQRFRNIYYFRKNGKTERNFFREIWLILNFNGTLQSTSIWNFSINLWMCEHWSNITYTKRSTFTVNNWPPLTPGILIWKFSSKSVLLLWLNVKQFPNTTSFHLSRSFLKHAGFVICQQSVNIFWNVWPNMQMDSNLHTKKHFPETRWKT